MGREKGHMGREKGHIGRGKEHLGMEKEHLGMEIIFSRLRKSEGFFGKVKWALGY